MKVLSLFDGIACARVALERAGIEVEEYYASEIEAHPITIAKKNWPDIVHLGDVTQIRIGHYNGLRDPNTFIHGNGHDTQANDIDLLIGGSPCQDLSRAKTDGKGLSGERSGLFYEYLRILKETKPKWFILENVASMKQVYKDEITKELGVKPIMIDAALVSAQTRKRLFWTNIPGICQPYDRGILLKDILEDGYPMGDKARTITRSYMKGPCIGNIGTHRERTMVATKPIRIGTLEGTNGGQGSRVYSVEGKSVTLPSHTGGNKTGLYYIGKDGKLVVREATKKGYAVAEEGDSVDLSFPNSTTRRGRVGKKAKNLMTSQNIHVFTKGDLRPLTAVECERLQSLPDGYTEGVPKTHRVAACGNAFNVEVVAHILRHIPKQ